jgi:hypothetical protein
MAYPCGEVNAVERREGNLPESSVGWWSDAGQSPQARRTAARTPAPGASNCIWNSFYRPDVTVCTVPSRSVLSSTEIRGT